MSFPKAWQFGPAMVRSAVKPDEVSAALLAL
jgi:hypothetical protein